MKPANGFPDRTETVPPPADASTSGRARRFVALAIVVVTLATSTTPCRCQGNGEQSKIRLTIPEEIPVGSLVVNLLNHVDHHDNHRRQPLPEATTSTSATAAAAVAAFDFLLVTKNKMHEELFQLDDGFSDVTSLPQSPSSPSMSRHRPLIRGNGLLRVKSRIDREALCPRREVCDVRLEVEVARTRSRKIRSHDGLRSSLVTLELQQRQEVHDDDDDDHDVEDDDGDDDNDDGREDNKNSGSHRRQQSQDNHHYHHHHHRNRKPSLDVLVAELGNTRPQSLQPLQLHRLHATSGEAGSRLDARSDLDLATVSRSSDSIVSRSNGQTTTTMTKTTRKKGRDCRSDHVVGGGRASPCEIINKESISSGLQKPFQYDNNNNSGSNKQNKNNDDNSSSNNKIQHKVHPRPFSTGRSETETESAIGNADGISIQLLPKRRTVRDYFFQILEIIIIITDINDNPPQFVVDESDLSLVRASAETGLAEQDRISKWENETELSFSVYVPENSPLGHSFAVPCYVEDPDSSDHLDRDNGRAPMTFEHTGNCSELIRFSVKTESESDTYLRRGKRSDVDSDHFSIQDHHHHRNRHRHHHRPKSDSLQRVKRQHMTTTTTTTSLWLTVLNALDRETVDRCYVDVRAKDSAGNAGKLLRIRVLITDSNDNKPVFESDTLRLQLPEDRPPSLADPIAEVKATDLDIGENGRIVYSFARATQTNLGWLFHIDSDTGKIFLKSRMNTAEASAGLSTVLLEATPATGSDEQHRQQQQQSPSPAVETRGFKLRVLASNPVPGSATSQADVVVVPTDVNDHSPRLRISPDPIEVLEEAESTGQVVGHVMVEDLDTGENGRTRCAFSNWSSLEEEEEEEEGKHEEDDDYDDGLANDDDDDDYNNAYGSDFFRLIKVNEKLYRLVTRRKFDRERAARHKVTLFCWDHGTPRLSTSRDVDVLVRDINDNRPIFRQSRYEVQVPENNHVGAAAILKVTADDADEGANANVSYSIRAKLPHDAGDAKDGKPSLTTRDEDDDDDSDDDDDDVEKIFSIDSDTGIIYAMKSFDYEAVRQYHFHVLASDSGRNGDNLQGDTSDTFVVVNVVDVNDEPPLFSSDKHEFFVVENGPPETEVGVVVVTDADASPAFTRYNLTVESSFPPPTSGGSFFHLEEDTGRLVTSRTLDREQYSVHHLWLVVRNTATPHLSSTSHVIVHVTDTNDNAPLIEYPSPDDHSIQLKCSSTPGSVVARLRARDADAGENASLEYSVAKGNDAGIVAIDAKSGLVTLARMPLDLLEYKMASERQNAKRTTEETRTNQNWTSGVEMKFEVVFVVRDQGLPPKSAETRLEILINCTLADLQRRSGKVTKSDDLLNFLVNSAGFQTDSFKKILTSELLVAIFGAVMAVLLVAATMVVCVRIRRSSRSNHRSFDRNNSKSGLSDSDFKLNISNKMTSQTTSPAENHYHVTPGATRLIAGKSELHSSVKEDNIKNEMLLMNRTKIDDDDDVAKMGVKGYDYHSSQTLEKSRQGNGVKSFSPPQKSDHGSLTRRSEMVGPTAATTTATTTTTGFSTFISSPHVGCCPDAKQQQQRQQQPQQQQQQQQQQQHHQQQQCNSYTQPPLSQQQQQQQHHHHQQQFGYHGNSFQKTHMRPSLKLMRQEMTLTEAEKRKESLVSSNEVNRLLDILKSSHDNPGHYASSDWPPIEDFNQSDIIWGQCVDDVIDDYDICDPEYEKL